MDKTEMFKKLYGGSPMSEEDMEKVREAAHIASLSFGRIQVEHPPLQFIRRPNPISDDIIRRLARIYDPTYYDVEGEILSVHDTPVGEETQVRKGLPKLPGRL